MLPVGSFVAGLCVGAGAMLGFNRIVRAELDHGAVSAMIDDSWFWLLAWAAVAGVSIALPLRWVAGVAFPGERWRTAPPRAALATPA